MADFVIHEIAKLRREEEIEEIEAAVADMAAMAMMSAPEITQEVLRQLSWDLDRRFRLPPPLIRAIVEKFAGRELRLRNKE